MTNEKKSQVIHVGIDHHPAVQAKKEILMSEASLLEIIKKIRAYSTLRKKEFILKNRIKKSMATVKTLVSKIKKELPDQKEIQIPKKYELKQEEVKTPQKAAAEIVEEKQEEVIEKIEKIREKTETKEKNMEIEHELEEIKQKLARLG